jgi:hypothetical protein
MVEQGEHSAADRITGCFLATDYQQKSVKQDFQIGELGALDFANREGANQVARRALAAFADKPGKIGKNSAWALRPVSIALGP